MEKIELEGEMQVVLVRDQRVVMVSYRNPGELTNNQVAFRFHTILEWAEEIVKAGKEDEEAMMKALLELRSGKSKSGLILPG